MAYRFFRGAIDQRRSLYLASPLKGTLIQLSGRFAELYTAYAGELQMLRSPAEYSRSGADTPEFRSWWTVGWPKRAGFVLSGAWFGALGAGMCGHTSWSCPAHRVRGSRVDWWTCSSG